MITATIMRVAPHLCTLRTYQPNDTSRVMKSTDW